jgi:hypothetical protein
VDHLIHAGFVGGAAVAFVIFVAVDVRRRGLPSFRRAGRRPGER